jgi:hypothetical protein
MYKKIINRKSMEIVIYLKIFISMTKILEFISINFYVFKC